MFICFRLANILKSVFINMYLLYIMVAGVSLTLGFPAARSMVCWL